MGIAVDILVVLFLLVSIYRGWRVGFLYQLGILAFLVVAYFVARALTGLLDAPVAKALNASPLVASTITFFAIFFVLAIIGGFLVRSMTKDLIPDKSSLSDINRALGAIVSLAKGALIAYLAIVVLLQIQRISGNTPFPVQSSIATRFVAENNVLDRGELGALVKLGWLVSTRDTNELGQDPRAQKLMAHPKAQGLFTPELLAAVRNQDYVALFDNDALWEFLRDSEVQETLDSFDWIEDDGAAAPASP